MSNLKVLPEYGSIGCVQDICEPWIALLEGDEWGESMRALHQACTVSYGFSDEDCALFAGKLFDNLQYMKDNGTIDEEAESAFGLFTAEDVAKVQAECRRIRDFWRNQQWEPTRKAADQTLAPIPGWIFGE